MGGKKLTVSIEVTPGVREHLACDRPVVTVAYHRWSTPNTTRIASAAPLADGRLALEVPPPADTLLSTLPEPFGADPWRFGLGYVVALDEATAGAQGRVLVCPEARVLYTERPFPVAEYMRWAAEPEAGPRLDEQALTVLGAALSALPTGLSLVQVDGRTRSLVGLEPAPDLVATLTPTASDPWPPRWF